MIKQIELESSKAPIAKVFHKGEDFRIISLGLKRGIILKEHKPPSLKQNIDPKNVVLIVVKGKVKFKSDRRNVLMNIFDKIEIQIDELHSVEGIEDSILLLILA